MQHRTCKGDHGRGPSSYMMHDSDLVFAKLALQPGETFLDMGCGPGDYTLRAAQGVGLSGKVCALDQTQRMLERVKQRAREHSLSNVFPLEQEMTHPLPLLDGSVDCCLFATSLHCLNLKTQGPALFREIHRVMADGGRVAILECKKEKMDFGPPLHMRINAAELEDVLGPCGLVPTAITDLGVNYMAIFSKG